MPGLEQGQDSLGFLNSFSPLIPLIHTPGVLRKGGATIQGYSRRRIPEKSLASLVPILRQQHQDPGIRFIHNKAPRLHWHDGHRNEIPATFVPSFLTGPYSSFLLIPTIQEEMTTHCY